MKKKKILISVIGLAVLLGAIPAGIFLVKQSQELRKSAAPATTLLFTPAALDKVTGDEFTLAMEIDTAENKVYSADVTVEYDPNIFELITLTQGSFFSEVAKDGQDSLPGSLRFVYFNFEAKGPEAEGIVASIGFRVKETALLGVSEITISKAESKVGASEPTADDTQYVDVLQTVRSSVIAVAGAEVAATPTPQPTVTPNPTETPGLTTTPTPTPDPEYADCWQSCTADSDCSGDLICESINGTYRCVNEDCMTDSDCNCSTGATPTPTKTPTPAAVGESTAIAPTTTPPVTGIAGPTLMMAVGSVLLLTLGLLVLVI